MAKLVVYYSRADENYFAGAIRRIEVGNTEKVAKMIAEKTGADIFKLEQKEPYSEKYDECIAQAKDDLHKKVRPELKLMPKSLFGYDEIYLGYPNYWGTMPMAVFTFLDHFEFTGIRIHPFCTHEGSGLGSSVMDLKKAAHGAKVTPGLAIQGGRADSCGKELDRWI